MEHRHQPEEDDDVDQEPENRHDAGKPVVDQHKSHDGEEAQKSGHHATSHGVGSECRRDAAGFLDLNRHTQRVFKCTGEFPCFLVREVPGDLSVTEIVVALQGRRRENLAIKKNGHLVALVLRGNLVKKFCTLGIELERNPIALLVKEGKGPGDMLPRESGSARDEDLGDILRVLRFFFEFVVFENVGRRHDLLAGANAGNVGFPTGIDHGEFQLCDLLELVLRLLGLLGIQSGDLDKDPVLALRADDRLADPVLIDALADDFHRLIEEVLGDAGFGLRDEFDEKRGAALKVEAEADFFPGRPDLPDAIGGEADR